jgi:hypothetical protein
LEEGGVANERASERVGESEGRSPLGVITEARGSW